MLSSRRWNCVCSKKHMARPVGKVDVRMAQSVCINVSGLGVPPAKIEICAIQAS